MYCPTKLPIFIKKCPLKPRELLYIFICIVPQKLLLFIKNVLLNFTICYIYLYVLLP